MTSQQLNLDWLLDQMKKIMHFLPFNGVSGDVLQRTVDGAAWMPLGAVSMDIHGLTSTTPDAADELPIYDNDLVGNYKVTVQDILDMIPASPVTSVNGQTGAVSLTIPTQTSDLINDDGFVDAAGAAAAAPVQSVNGQTGAVIVSGGAVDSVNGQTGTVVIGKSDVGLGNVDNVQQYSASNPPPYPVTSVNGQTGAVTVTGMSLTLLWTNSSILSSFSSQTIPLDLSAYDFIIIEYVAGSGGVAPIMSAWFKVPILPPPTGYTSYNMIEGCYFSGSNIKIGLRELQVSTSGVAFLGGTRVEALNNSNTSDDTLCRPSRIWGVK